MSIFESILGLENSLADAKNTPAPHVNQQANTFGDGWRIQTFMSGPAAGMVAFLSEFDKSLVIWSADAENILHQENQIYLTEDPVLIARDEAGGKIIVVFGGPANGGVTMKSFDMKTFQSNDLTSPRMLPRGTNVCGIVVSNDGAKIYVGGINAPGHPAFFILPNQ
jgi:hypothetical protein